MIGIDDKLTKAYGFNVKHAHWRERNKQIEKKENLAIRRSTYVFDEGFSLVLKVTLTCFSEREKEKNMLRFVMN